MQVLEPPVHADRDREAPRSSRRVFLPVAPSFARMLHVGDDVSSVDSFDDRRYSDVPSARSLSMFPRAGPNTTMTSSVPLSPTSTTTSMKVNPPTTAQPAVTATPSPPHSRKVAPSPTTPVTVRPQPVRMWPLPTPVPPPTPPPSRTRRSWRRLLPRIRLLSNNSSSSDELRRDRDRVDDQNEEQQRVENRRKTTCIPSRSGRRSKAGTASDRPRPSGAATDSFARLPRMCTADAIHEPHSFAGFRQKPWVLLSEEGSSVSSSEWDFPPRAPSSLESRSRMR